MRAELEPMIPTLPDLMDQINQRLVESVADDEMAADMAAAVAEIFTTGADGDLFTLLAVARGCHSAAEVRRKQGRNEMADLLFAMAQDMLATAVDTWAAMAAVDVHVSGITRH